MSKEVLHIDHNLVLELRDGNEHAFEELFKKYQKDVFRYVQSLIKSKKHAEEVTQDVFIKVWLKRKTLHPEKSFKSFLFTIAKNKSYDFLVKASKDLKLKQYVFYHRSISHNPIEDYLLSIEYQSLKQRAIDCLSPRKKRIFEMSRNEGKSYREIAAELGIAKQTVKNQMSQALGNISAFLESYGGITFTLVQILLLI